MTFPLACYAPRCRFLSLPTPSHCPLSLALSPRCRLPSKLTRIFFICKPNHFYPHSLILSILSLIVWLCLQCCSARLIHQAMLWRERPEVVASGMLMAMTKAEVNRQEALCELISSESAYLSDVKVPSQTLSLSLSFSQVSHATLYCVALLMILALLSSFTVSTSVSLRRC